MNSYIGLAFDVAILAALGATIFHALKLSKQITQMQADRRAFESLISALNVAASRAEAAIKAFKETATDSGEKLQDKINKGRAMADELEIVIEAGDNLAERLTQKASKARRPADEELDEPATATPATAAKAGMEPRTRAEKELLEALRAKQKT